MHHTERGSFHHGLAIRLAVDHAVACGIRRFPEAIRWAVQNWPDFLNQTIPDLSEERKRQVGRYRWWINLAVGQPPPDHAPLPEHFCWNKKVQRAERQWEKWRRRRRRR